MHARRQQQSRHSDRPQVFIFRAWSRAEHDCSWFGQEVLDDDFLQMSPSLMRTGQSHESIDAIAPCLADTHENAAGEGNLQISGGAQGVDAALGFFVGRSAMAIEIVAQRFEHHALRW